MVDEKGLEGYLSALVFLPIESSGHGDDKGPFLLQVGRFDSVVRGRLVGGPRPYARLGYLPATRCCSSS